MGRGLGSAHDGALQTESEMSVRSAVRDLVQCDGIA